MNKNVLRVGAAAGIIAAIVIAVKLSSDKSDTPLGTPTPSASALPTAKVTPKPTATASPTAMPTATPAPTSSHYQNVYLAIDVPAGWTLTESTNQQVAAQHAVSITKGNWILYINPAASQASGVEGGRFDEYAAGAAGVETVMGDLEKPRYATQCANLHSTSPNTVTIMGTSVTRHDFWTIAGSGDSGCHLPQGSEAWFFATVGKQVGFNTVDSVTNKPVATPPNDFPVRQFAITMTYKATSPNTLLRDGDPDLLAALMEMDNIVSTLVFR